MLLNNPIFAREFFSYAKGTRIKVLVGGYLLLLALSLLALWPTSGTLSLVSDSGKQIFALFFSINLVLQLLMVPAFTATAITVEKEQKTFASLYITLLTPLEIMSGKLFSSLSMLIILVLLSTPIGAACALTGGITLTFLAKVVCLILVTSVSYGLLGLACSATSERSSAAVLKNYIYIMIFAGGTWLPMALIGSIPFVKSIPIATQILQFIKSISPFDALFSLVYPENYALGLSVQNDSSLFTPYVIFLISSFLIGLVSLIIFYKRVSNPTKTKSKSTEGVYEGGSQSIKRKLKWPFYLIDPLKRKKLIGRFSNPVFVAEMRSNIFANPGFIIRTVTTIIWVSMVMLILIALQFGTGVTQSTMKAVTIVFQLGLIALLAPGISSGLITDEISSGTFLTLRMTPLSPLTVILGKLKATFFYAMIFITCSLFIVIIFIYLEEQNIMPKGLPIEGKWWSELFTSIQSGGWRLEFWNIYNNYIIWLLLLFMSTGMFLSSGLFASAFCDNTKNATAVAYGIVATLCIISFAPIVMTDKVSADTAGIILSVNPIAAAIQVTKAGLQEYTQLWLHNIIAMFSLSVVFLTASTFRVWHLLTKQQS